MKKLLFVLTIALLAAAATGCNSCGGGGRRSWCNWWNRGDSCRTCNSGEVYSEEPGLIGAPILNNVPAAPRSSIENLPGPILTPIQ